MLYVASLTAEPGPQIGPLGCSMELTGDVLHALIFAGCCCCHHCCRCHRQETPTSLAITDLSGSVQSVQFAGKDLNLGSLTGRPTGPLATLSQSPSTVASYACLCASRFTGNLRFSSPSTGETQLSQYAGCQALVIQVCNATRSGREKARRCVTASRENNAILRCLPFSVHWPFVADVGEPGAQNQTPKPCIRRCTSPQARRDRTGHRQMRRSALVLQETKRSKGAQVPGVEVARARVALAVSGFQESLIWGSGCKMKPDNRNPKDPDGIADGTVRFENCLMFAFSSKNPPSVSLRRSASWP